MFWGIDVTPTVPVYPDELARLLRSLNATLESASRRREDIRLE